jgi:hypothetical protein
LWRCGGETARRAALDRFRPAANVCSWHASSFQRADYLFVHVADGRRWYIPATEVAGGTGILLGGPKYAAFEIESGRPFEAASSVASLDSMAARRGSRAVKGVRL